MFQLKATIKNTQGIHLRPSGVIMKAAETFKGNIEIVSDSGSVDLRSIYDIMILGLEKGDSITVRVDGDGDEAFGQKLAELFETEFDFSPQD